MISYALVLLIFCAATGDIAFGDSVSTAAVEGIIKGVPVPEGSVLDEDAYYSDEEGVEMASYSHPHLSGRELLQFYDFCMPQWGWQEVEEGRHRLQRSYNNGGVPVLIGVDKKKRGASFNILKGAAGDWGYIPSLRPESAEE